MNTITITGLTHYYHGLQIPPPVPHTPDDTVSLEQFQIVQHNLQRLWQLHKSIKVSLRILELFGTTYPNR